MKKILLLLALFCAGNIYGQEGSMYIGGIAGFSSTKTGDFEQRAWDFSPEIGYWLSDNIQAGIAINLGGTSNSNNISTSNFSPLAYFRKWHKFSDLISVYGGFNMGSISREETGFNQFGPSTETDKTKGLSVFFDFGASLALSDRWSVMGRYAALGYEYEKLAGSDISRTTYGFGVDTLNNPFNLGIYYIIRK